MTILTATSHTDKRKHGITVETTEYFDEAKVLVKKKLSFFNSDNCLTLICTENLLDGTITELKPKPLTVQPLDNSICFIKTIYDTKYYMLSQGTADKEGEYHGMVSVFKPHKTRLEEYHHGTKIADLTHPIRDKLIRLGILSTLIGTLACVCTKCDITKKIYNEQK